MINKTILMGSSRCGMKLLAAILNCSQKLTISTMNRFAPKFNDNNILILSIDPEIYQDIGIKILDKLNSLKQTNVNYVWVVRDPVISATSLMENYGLNEQESLRYWYEVNVCIWYMYSSLPSQNRQLIKFEDIIFHKIREIFQFLNAPFDDQYIQYGDFDQPSCNCPVFQLGYPNAEQIDIRPKSNIMKKLWETYKTKELMRFLNYDRKEYD